MNEYQFLNASKQQQIPLKNSEKLCISVSHMMMVRLLLLQKQDYVSLFFYSCSSDYSNEVDDINMKEY